MFKSITIFIIKLLVLLVILDLGLRWVEKPWIKEYNFKSRGERLSARAMGLSLKLRMHQVSQPKAPGELRIIMLGNSAVFGGNLPHQYTSSYHLQKFLEKSPLNGRARVFNLAANGAYAQDNFLILHEALRYQPDVVFWGLTLRDFHIPNRITKGPVAGFNVGYLMSLGPWYEQHGYQELFRLLQEKFKLKKHRDLYWDQSVSRYWFLYRYREDLREIAIDRVLSLLPPKLSRDVTNFYIGEQRDFIRVPQKRWYNKTDYPFPNPTFAYFGAMRDLAKEHGVTLILFNMPTIFHDQAYPEGWMAKFYSYLNQEMPKLGTEYLDLSVLLSPGQEDFHDYLHLTSEGNRKVAEVLGRRLIEIYATEYKN